MPVPLSPWISTVDSVRATVSAMFSALALALAAFARSTKGGQYYFLPLLLVTMPLVVLPMSPGVELNLGNSLIPITGVVLLLRAMLEGSYLAALPYLPVVVITAYSSVESAIEAMRQGAFHYVPKPFKNEEVLHLVRRAAERRWCGGEERPDRADR